MTYRGDLKSLSSMLNELSGQNDLKSLLTTDPTAHNLKGDKGLFGNGRCALYMQERPEIPCDRKNFRSFVGNAVRCHNH